MREHRSEGSDLRQLLRGYRFSVCQDVAAAARALDVRRRVYMEGNGFPIPIPDRYDERSWLLLGEDAATGRAVGSMRITPRSGGPFEAEEYFSLPPSLALPRVVEISRFAILPEYRKGRTFLPAVSCGLFKLVLDFLRSRDVDRIVICARPERVWTFEWLRFERSGLTAPYGKLGNTPHELLWLDFWRLEELSVGHPFEELLMSTRCPEVELPERTPAFGLAIHDDHAARRPRLVRHQRAAR